MKHGEGKGHVSFIFLKGLVEMLLHIFGHLFVKDSLFRA